MIIQRINRTNPEKVFVVVRNDETSALTKGALCSFKFDGTRNGLDVEKSDAAANAHLIAGIADTAIAAGAYGLAQCYGVRTDAIIIKSGTATNKNAAVGDALIFDSSITGLSGVAAGAASAYFPGFVMGETMASSSASGGTTTATVFIRLM